jgi:2-isopropylmalate synthase
VSSSADPATLIHDWNTAEGTSFTAKRAVSLLDDTLRDGLQNAAVRMPTRDEKAEMLGLMAGIGVSCVNLGLPGSSRQAFDDARYACEVRPSRRAPGFRMQATDWK